MKIQSAIILLFSCLGLWQCEVQQPGCTDYRAINYNVSADYDDGSCKYGVDPTDETCRPDHAGNLVINNQTGKMLYLYKGDAFVTCVPSDSESFLINIPNENLGICPLKIWKAEDVPDMYNPDISRVYRQWSVALSNTTAENERANWLITGSDQYGGSGTLLLTYPDVDEYGQQVLYQVDILLNSKDGAKLASLQPGVTGKMVSVDFGVHYLYFHYWYSDPGSSSGDITDLGWNEMKDIVINELHKEAEIDIPAYYSIIGKYGELKVVNNKDQVVTVYANDKLIETIAKVDGSAQGLSNVPANGESTFLIPVEQYTISIKTLDGSSSSSFKGVDIVQNQTAVIQSGIKYRTVQVSNKTDLTLGLFTEDEEYLGLAIAPGESTAQFLVPESLDTLKFVDFNKTKMKIVGYSSSITLNELDDYDYNRLTFSNAWPVNADSVYESPQIDNDEQTIMQATLENTKSATLEFEYNVSSEADYDYFSFTIDGSTMISKISGESGWQSFSVVLDPGTHSLQWIYTKDEMFGLGRDNVQLRNITVYKN